MQKEEEGGWGRVLPRLLAVFIVVCIVRLMSLDLHRKNKEKPSKFNLPWKKLEKKMSKKKAKKETREKQAEESSGRAICK